MTTRPGSSKTTTAQPKSVVQLLRNPIVAFAGSAGVVFLLGSLVLVTIWIFSGGSSATVAAVGNDKNESSVAEDKEALAVDMRVTQPDPSVGQPDAAEQQERRELASVPSPRPNASDAPGSVRVTAGATHLDAFHRASLPPLELDSRQAEAYAERRFYDPTDFSLDFNSGVLAIVGPWEREVGFLTHQQLAEGAEAGSITKVKLPGRPVCVEYKPLPAGGVFLVGYASPGGTALIDSEIFKVLKRFPCEGVGVGFITCASDPNATEAFLFPAGSSGEIGETVRLNTHEMRIDATWRNSTRGLVSADGKTIFTHEYGPIRPTTEEGFNWEPNPALRREVRLESAGFSYHLDPRGRFVTCGREVYPLKFDRKLSSFEFEASAVSAVHPWMAGIGRDEFIIGSTNSGRVLQRIKTPVSWRPERCIPKEESRRTHVERSYDNAHARTTWAKLLDCEVFADDKNSQFILAHSGGVFCFPYDDLDLSQEPDLWMTSPTPEMAYIGKPLQFEIETPTEGVVVELESQLDDAKIEGNTFHWTPSSKGRKTFVAKISKGDVSHSAVWTIDVDLTTAPKLDIPFFVMNAHVSLDESRMAILGYSEKPARSRSNTNATPILAVMDLATKRIVAQKDLSVGTLRAVFCGDEILMSTRGGTSFRSEVLRFNASDLSLVGQASTANGTIVPIADQVVAVRDRSNPTFYSVPELQLISPRQPVRIDGRDGRRLADGWTYQSLLWDREFKKPKLLYDAATFAKLDYQPRPQIPVKHVYFGFVLDQPATMQVNRKIQRNTRRDCDVFSANIDLESNNDYIKVNFTDIINGELRHEAILETMKSGGGFYGTRDTPRKVVDWTSKEMFAVWSGKLYAIDLAPIRAKFPRPFYIIPEQSAFVLKGRKPKVSYRAEDATNITLEIPEFSTGTPNVMESADGDFIIETPDPTELGKKVWLSIGAQGRSGDVGKMKKYLERISAQYKLITGRKPAGVPIAVSAYVTATGPNLETAVLQHYYLLDVPQSVIKRTMPASPVPSRGR